MSTVLIVDDSHIIRRVMSVTLEKQGYDVQLAEDGQEAVDILENGEFDIDVVFTDINMPIMDGISMLSQIRNNKELKQIPVVMLTGVGEEADHHRALIEGANSVLTKPSSSYEIIATLQSLGIE